MSKNLDEHNKEETPLFAKDIEKKGTDKGMVNRQKGKLNTTDVVHLI